MAVALIAVSIIFGKRPAAAVETAPQMAEASLWGGGIVSLGLILMIFGGFKSGFAPATEISAFAVLYALVVGGGVFRELGWRPAARNFGTPPPRSPPLPLFVPAGTGAPLRPP